MGIFNSGVWSANALETGRYDPSLPLAFAIAKLFKLVIDDFLTP